VSRHFELHFRVTIPGGINVTEHGDFAVFFFFQECAQVCRSIGREYDIVGHAVIMGWKVIKNYSIPAVQA
jgi:hypothetical protein